MLAAIRQWVIKTMTKGQTGVVTTMPKQEIIEMNVQITAERIMRNGINPNDLKTVGQVENVVEQIDAPKVVSADSAEGRGITEQLLGKKKADVLDMEGNKIDTSKGIMGGKEVKSFDELKNYTKSEEEIVQDLVDQKFGKGYFDDVDGSEAAIKDAAIKARLDASNKKGIETIKINLVDDSIAKIKSMKPMDAMKEANLVAGKKGRYANLDDNQVKKIMDDTEDHIFERDIPDEDFATGGRVGYAGGSDMGTVSGTTRSANTGLKGGYQNTGTSPVERPGGGGGGSKPPPVIRRTGDGGITDIKLKKPTRFNNIDNDFTKFNMKDLISYGLVNPDEEDEYSEIEGQTAGLNQEQVDYLNKVGEKIFSVDKTGDFFNYDSPTNIKNKIEDLNSKSTNIFGTFKPDKIVEGDKNTFATEKDVQDYIKSQFPTLRTGGTKIGLANGGRIGLKAGSVDKMRRLILKAMGAGTVGIGAAKSGIFSGFGKGAGKTVAKEVAQQTTSSMPPPYFFKLAEKIKKLGSDTTPTNDRTIAKSLKSKDGKSDYILEEDVTSGDTIIKKVNKEGDEMITDVEIMEFRKGEVVMGKNGKPVKTPDEYEEVTEANARIEGDVFNDPYYSDGIQVDEIIKEVDDKVPSIKYASGGLAYMLGE